LDSDEFAVLRVGIVDSQITAAAATLVQIPEVGELGEERTGDILYGPVAHVREDEEQHGQGQQGPRGEEQRQEHRGRPAVLNRKAPSSVSEVEFLDSEHHRRWEGGL